MTASKKHSRIDREISESDEQIFSLVFVGHSAIMLLVEPHTGAIIDANLAALAFYGYSRSEICSMSIEDLNVLPLDQVEVERNKSLSGDQPYIVFLQRMANGEERIVEVNSYAVSIQNKQLLVSIIHDITGRNHAERTLRENELRFRSLFDDSPISLWEENFSAVKRRLDDLRSIGVVDFETYLSQHPEIVAECVALVEVLDVNKATLNLYGAASKGHLVTNLAASLPEAGNENFRDELVLIASGALHFEMEMIAKTLDGKMLTVHLNWAVIPGYENDLSRIIVSIIDITERKRAELELKTLLDIMQGLVVAKDLKDFLSLVHQSIAKVIDAENFFVILYNTETAMFEEVYSVDKFDPPAPPSQLENSISAYVFRTGEPLLLTDTGFDELKSHGKLKLVGSKMCSWLGVPLKTSSETIGVMVVQNYDHANRYSDRDSAFLFSIAGQVALAVERKQADEALQRSEERYRTLFDSMMDGIYRSSHEGKFVDINPAMVKIFGFSSREEMMTVDIKKDLYFAPEDRGSHILDAGQKQIDVYRMRRKDGSEIWVEDHGYYVHDEKGGILYHEGMLRDITGRKQAEDELRLARETLDLAHQELERSFLREQKLAHIDDLTGINNRRSLFELARHEFNVSLRYRPMLSILMFDIDNFKKINDTFGHAIGDQVLIGLTRIICDQLRSADVIGRYGGDEFVILLPQSSVQDALSLADRIHNSLAVTRIETEKGQLVVTVSIGITQTIHNTLQPDSVETLFLRADQALYAAKQAGRNRTVVFEE